jgi:hypothetical protein
LLVLCKTASSLAYGVLLVPLVRFAKPKLQIKVAMILVTIALTYPITRAAQLVPTQAIFNFAASISPSRAESLQIRFTNEEQLLHRASHRFFFGWGRYGRNRIYDEYGNDVSYTDGRWIITMGDFGFIGFLAEFGLLALPIFRAASALRFVASPKDKVLFTALSLILAINMFDLLPNSPLRPWTWLLTGALLGQAEGLRALARRKRSDWMPNLSPANSPSHVVPSVRRTGSEV